MEKGICAYCKEKHEEEGFFCSEEHRGIFKQEQKILAEKEKIKSEKEILTKGKRIANCQHCGMSWFLRGLEPSYCPRCKKAIKTTQNKDMVMIICHNCGTDKPEHAAKCPSCRRLHTNSTHFLGIPIKYWMQQRDWLLNYKGQEEEILQFRAALFKLDRKKVQTDSDKYGLDKENVVSEEKEFPTKHIDKPTEENDGVLEDSEVKSTLDKLFVELKKSSKTNESVFQDEIGKETPI